MTLCRTLACMELAVAAAWKIGVLGRKRNQKWEKNAQAKCKQEIEYWKWGRYYFLLHHSTFIPNKQVNVAQLYLHFKWYICSSYYYTIDMGSLQNLYIKAQLLATVHPHQWEHVTSNLCICMCVAMADFQSSSLQSICFDCTTDMEGLLHSQTKRLKHNIVQ